jgi:uncharacterized phage protein (TIGR02218 family)
MVHAFRAGIMDNGIFKCEILFLPDWNNTSIPPVLHFFGRMSIKELSAIQIDLEVRSETEMLDIELPRHTTVPSCIHQVYEVGCDLNKDLIGINGTVLLNSSVSVIRCGLAQAAGWFDLGVILFTDGLNNSVRRTVRSYSPGFINLVYPIPYVPQAGDHFIVYPGCDGTVNTCQNKFNNLSHFRGCPFVPTSETIY